MSDQELADIGVAGLAVMGSNLARNLARNGYRVALYNRTTQRTQELVDAHGAEGAFVPATTIEEFTASLRRPRTVLIMVKAGAPTDAVISELADHLEPGDIIVDGGNTHFPDTIAREAALRERGLHFVGTGVSGGEEGALNGPSIMPGGTREAYATLGPMLEKISAHVDGEPCCTYIGPDGAGHYVKMVHNGIEYADMQLIAEAYDLLRSRLGATAAEIGDIFSGWNSTELESYLIEITARVLAKTDPVSGGALVDVVADQAEQKGTGRWTVQSALDIGVPITGIAEATFARALSGSTPQREAARAAHLPGGDAAPVADRDAFISDVRQALYASKIVAYSQGFDQIAAASAEHDWKIDRGACARIWRGGCIIRAALLDDICAAFHASRNLPNLLLAPNLSRKVMEHQEDLRQVVCQAVESGLPVPGLMVSLGYLDAYRSAWLPANLIQAQRDYFGAHTYERIDAKGTFHTEWEEE